MLDFNYIMLIFLFLVILQTMAGVGVLVIGTPTLLFLNYSIVEILSILLPVSIITSLVNLIYFKILRKEIKLIIDRDYRKFFFVFCVPAIFMGLYTIKKYGDYLNFKYLVSSVIFFSLIITTNQKIIFSTKKFNKSFSLVIIGFIHGLTNSGGSLLSLFLSSYLDKNNSRFNITYFYFFLAAIQFLIFNLIFDYKFYKYELLKIIPIIFLGIIMGNFLIKYFSKREFKLLINLLSLIVCLFLLIKN